jgi:hypothetical protein
VDVSQSIAEIGATVQAWKFRVAQLQSMMPVSDTAMWAIEAAQMEVSPRVVARLGTRQDTPRQLTAMHTMPEIAVSSLFSVRVLKREKCASMKEVCFATGN